MIRLLARLGVVAAALCTLAGCIISEYDLAAELTPEFPLTGTAYRDPDGKIHRFKRVGNAYVVREGEDAGNSMRFFKIPEYSGYVFQYHAADKDQKTAKTTVKYGYYLADLTKTGFVIKDWTEQAVAQLPANVQRLVTADTEHNVTVKDAAHDTLTVVREMARANLPTKEFAYTSVDTAKKK
jgi:hypothetical protein